MWGPKQKLGGCQYGEGKPQKDYMSASVNFFAVSKVGIYQYQLSTINTKLVFRQSCKIEFSV